MATDHKKRHREIEKEIKEDWLKSYNQINFLILGAEASGKTSIINQMIQGSKCTDEETAQMRSIARSNAVMAMLSCCDEMHNSGNAYSMPTNAEKESHLRSLQVDKVGLTQFSHETHEALKSLWADKSIQSLHGKKQCTMDSSWRTYIVSPHTNFFPPLRFFEIRTHRSQMKKWMHCFDFVKVISYVVDLSVFDQHLENDASKNRMHESLELFEKICNNLLFINTNMIVFLNKKDLLQQKLSFTSIRTAFEDYNGDQTFEASVAFIEKKYMDMNNNSKRPIYSHVTCAAYPQIDNSGTFDCVGRMFDLLIGIHLDKLFRE